MGVMQGVFFEFIGKIWVRRVEKVKTEIVDKLTGKLLYLVIISLFLVEFSAGLAIAHLDAVYECEASSCVMERHNTK